MRQRVMIAMAFVLRSELLTRTDRRRALESRFQAQIFGELIKKLKQDISERSSFSSPTAYGVVAGIDHP